MNKKICDKYFYFWREYFSCANKMCSIFFHPCILQDWNDEMVVDTAWNGREKNKISTIIYRHRYCLSACMYEIFFMHLSVKIKFMLLAKWWSLSAHCNMCGIKWEIFMRSYWKSYVMLYFTFDFLQGKMISFYLFLTSPYILVSYFFLVPFKSTAISW